MDGSTQPGYSGTPNINVVGESGGFTISAGPSTVQDLAITGCGGTGVTINDTRGNDTVSGCYIGVAPDGNTAAENLGYGVEISGSCGNSLQSDVISANALGGVEITSGASNTIANCAIGTNADGTAAPLYLGYGLQGYGVEILNSPSNKVDNDVISDNPSGGVHISGGKSTGNTVTNSNVGTDESGAKALGNTGDGVLIDNGAVKRHRRSGRERGQCDLREHGRRRKHRRFADYWQPCRRQLHRHERFQHAGHRELRRRGEH